MASSCGSSITSTSARSYVRPASCRWSSSRSCSRRGEPRARRERGAAAGGGQRHAYVEQEAPDRDELEHRAEANGVRDDATDGRADDRADVEPGVVYPARDPHVLTLGPYF